MHILKFDDMSRAYSCLGGVGVFECSFVCVYAFIQLIEDEVIYTSRFFFYA